MAAAAYQLPAYNLQNGRRGRSIVMLNILMKRQVLSDSIFSASMRSSLAGVYINIATARFNMYLGDRRL